mgnify:CR=1 FL=1
MAWQDFAPFTSSHIAAIRYDKDQLLLDVAFPNSTRSPSY